MRRAVSTGGARRRRWVTLMMSLIATVIAGVAFIPSASAMYGGEDATRLGGQVQIFLGDVYACTGTLLSETWVLTAGHCLVNRGADPVTVRLGDLRIGQGELRTTRSINTWPYTVEGGNRDAGLIELSEPTTHVDLRTPYGVGELPPGAQVKVRGWGTTGLNADRPASVLKESTHTVDTGAAPGEIALYANDGAKLQFGDSGAGVMLRGLLCGVYEASPVATAKSTATSIDSVGAWILQTTRIAPALFSRCDAPRKRDLFLKVMSFGTALAAGIGSADGNGARKQLHDRLWSDVQNVDLVGTEKSGGMSDNQHEGHSGWLISDLQRITAEKMSALQPNIVTLSAGVEDMVTNTLPEFAAGRLRTVVETTFTADPDVTVIVSTLTPSKDPVVQGRIDQFNATLPLIVEEMQKAGRHIDLADMAPVTTGDLYDSTYPNDVGYYVMGDIFADTIQEAMARGWVADRSGGLEPREVRDLRPMALGSSTTYGQGSTHGNGYKAVADKGFSELIDPGSGSGGGTPHVDWVGSIRVGTMADREVEGWRGYILQDITAKARCAVRAYQPNLVTLIAGGNDMLRPVDPAGAPDRLRSLIEQIDQLSPGVVVLVAGMQPFRDTAANRLGKEFTAKIPGVVAQLRQRGIKVVYADTTGLQPSEIGADGIHPTDQGYDRIGNAFVKAAREAKDAGLLRQPNAAPEAEVHPCGLADDGAGGTGSSSSKSPGANWEDRGVVQSTDYPNESHWMVDFNRDGKADFISVDKNQNMRLWFNGGPNGAGWNPYLPAQNSFNPKSGAVGNALRFGDIDGDDWPDCMVIDLEGGIDLYTWDTTAPVGQRMCTKFFTGGTGGGQTRVYANGSQDWHPEWLSIDPQSKIRFADVTGGGRDDYIVIEPNDRTTMWANRGWTKKELLNPNPDIPPLIREVLDWAPGIRIGDPLASPRQIRYADLNGDKRADRILITAKGGARAWINEGPTGASGKFRDIGKIADDSGLPSADIQFYDLDGDGKADFNRIGHTGVTHLWLNKLPPAYFTKFHP
jgi:lysophospholipase L1-like esterase